MCIRRAVPQALLVITTGKTGPKSEDLALASSKMKVDFIIIFESWSLYNNSKNLSAFFKYTSEMICEILASQKCS